MVDNTLNQIIGIAKTSVNRQKGSFVKTIKLGLTVKDVIFIKKLGEFLWNLKDIPTEKRIELIRMLEKDSKNKNNAGEKILLLLELRMDITVMVLRKMVG